MALPKLGLIAMTRGMLGMGIGLLLSDNFSRGKRKAIGWTLLGVGIASTIPLAIGVFKKQRATTDNGRAMDMSSDRMTNERIPARENIPSH